MPIAYANLTSELSLPQIHFYLPVTCPKGQEQGSVTRLLSTEGELGEDVKCLKQSL